MAGHHLLKLASPAKACIDDCSYVTSNSGIYTYLLPLLLEIQHGMVFVEPEKWHWQAKSDYLIAPKETNLQTWRAFLASRTQHMKVFSTKCLPHRGRRINRTSMLCVATTWCSVERLARFRVVLCDRRDTDDIKCSTPHICSWLSAWWVLIDAYVFCIVRYRNHKIWHH